MTHVIAGLVRAQLRKGETNSRPGPRAGAASCVTAPGFTRKRSRRALRTIAVASSGAGRGCAAALRKGHHFARMHLGTLVLLRSANCFRP